MKELMWLLKSKGYEIEWDVESKTLSLQVPSSETSGWLWMLDHLNKSYNGLFVIQRKNANENKDVLLITIRESLQEHGADILRQAIIFEEYKPYPCTSTVLFDLKLGISCNNNCVHCVIKPQVHRIKQQHPEAVVIDSGAGMRCLLDLSYSQVIKILECQAPEFCRYILTGGEPTLRADLVHILRWIYYNRPYNRVAIQTNGRNLSDVNLVRSIYRFTRNPSFVVAIHGTEEVHNRIVNNRKEKGNPYQETIEGIKNLLQFYPLRYIRTEMVLTNLNMGCILESVRFQHEELGISSIGLSYPHLDGFSRETILYLAPNYRDLRKLLFDLNKYAVAHPDLVLRFEEIPVCIYNEIGSEIVLRSFELRSRDNTSVSFMGDYLKDFNSRWIADHAKFAACSECILNAECLGCWKESCELNEPFVNPIRQMTPYLQNFLAQDWGKGGRKNA